MVVQLLFFVSLLLVIFLVSKNSVNQIYLIIQKLFKNNKTAVWILAFVFLPGTIIHELSHLALALLLRVPTGPISIFPTFDDNQKKSYQIRANMGHIMVAKTDPFRLTIIGVAPMIIGLSIIYLLGKMFSFDLKTIWERGVDIKQILGIYLLFITSSTMFSSKQDLKSLLVTLPVTILIFTSLYLTDIQIVVGGEFLDKIKKLLTELNRGLILTAIINYAVFFISACLGRLGRSRLTRIG